MPLDMHERRERICNVLDIGEWKHSWHLPKNCIGETDWFSPDTAEQVRRVLQDRMDGAISLLGEVHALLHEIDWSGYEKLRQDRIATMESGDDV